MQYGMGRPQDKAHTHRVLKKFLKSVRGKQCERCGFAIHEILEIHHKNRNRSDNRLENLELVCPNCHAKEHVLKGKTRRGRIVV